MNWKRRAILSLLAGICISPSFTYFEVGRFAFGRLLEFPAWLAYVSLWGVHGSGGVLGDILVVSVLAVTYGLLIFGIWSFAAWLKGLKSS